MIENWYRRPPSPVSSYIVNPDAASVLGSICIVGFTTRFSYRPRRAMTIVLLSLLLLLGLFASAQNGLSTWTTTPLNAASFPLAVKTPYVNVWEPHANSVLSFSNTWAVVGPSYTVSFYIYDTEEGSPNISS